MTASTDVLFQPTRIGTMDLPNRIAMAPMTRSFSPGHVPGDNVAGYYRRRAEGGVGLIISEGVGTNTVTAMGTPDVPTIATEDGKAGWAHVAREVKTAGGKMGLQLWHEGPMRKGSQTANPDTPNWSPSGFKIPGKILWDPMTEDEIDTAINEFVDGAVACKDLGFDCAEFHGAHSYMIDSFFYADTNIRSDKWGGPSWENRTRFACEIIRRARAKVGPDFPLIIRLSQWKQQDFDARPAETPDEMQAWLSPLVDAGIDAIHCSQRRFWEPALDESDLNFAGWAKKLTGLPTISVGSVGLSGEFVAALDGESSQPTSLDKLIKRMEANEFDIIAVGRAILQDPEWVIKIREGRDDKLMNYDRSALKTLV